MLHGKDSANSISVHDIESDDGTRARFVAVVVHRGKEMLWTAHTPEEARTLGALLFEAAAKIDPLLDEAVDV